MRIRSFRFGDWLVDRDACTLALEGGTGPIQIEPRAMDVLTALCTQSGSILSAGDLLHLCWDGLNVGENQVHKAIAQLRRAFGDDASQPRYIENIRKRGYRTLADVTLDDADGDRSVAGSWLQGSPYVGLDPFDADRARLFFGREAAVAKLAATVTARAAAGQALVLVLGPSGSGKTSLIQAGLLPSLTAADHPHAVAAVTALDLGDVGEVPLLTAIGSALLDLEIDGQPVLAGQSAEAVGAALAAGTEGLPAGRFLLFVDRLEALFDPATIDDGQKSRFLAALDRLARGGAVIVVAACRNDFYPMIAREPVLMAAKADGGHFDLAPPNRAEIAQMIRLPALAAELAFGVDADSGENLADLLCDGAAHSPDALPLLQYTLQELYFQRSPNRELTVAAYRALGGIEGAIGKRAEVALSGLPAQAQAALFRVLPLLVSIGAEDGLVHSHRAPWSALGEEGDRSLVRALVEQRLFVTLVHEGQSMFGVAHEALLRQWPRVVDWIAEHRQALRTRSRLQAAAGQWLAEGRRSDLLLPRGKPLLEAGELAERPQFQLSPEVRELIAASVRRRRQGDAVRMAALAGFSALTVVAVILGLRASQAEAVASQRRLEAEDLMNYMVGDFVDKLRPLGRLDLLDEPAQKALRYLTGEDVASLPNAARLQQARALQTLAEVSRSRGNPDAAIQALDQASRLLQANLKQGPVDLELLKTLGAVAFWQGQIARDRGRLEEAERYFSQYRDHAERMNAMAPDEVAAWLALASARESLGSLADLTGNEEEAGESFAASVALRRRAAQSRPLDPTTQKDLANSLSWLASARLALGDLPAALDLLDEERALLERLYEAQPNSLALSRSLYLADRLIGNTLAAQGRTADALVVLGKGLKLSKNNVIYEPSNKLWKRGYLEINIEFLLLTLSAATAERTQMQLDGLTGDIDDLVRNSKIDINVARVLSLFHYAHALSFMLMEKLDRAEDAVNKAEFALSDVIKEMNNNKLAIISLSNVMLLKERILSRIGRLSEAKNTCLMTVENLRGIVNHTKDYRILDPWVRAKICIGDKDAVSESVNYLEKIGYKRAEYIDFIMHPEEY